ncbi:MAG: glycine--tRNA ligase [Candidatus Peregrinibacteria bacterium]|nr:glycine--tRNA ligase [Candidatus Peregrinibacteria bacterium]
MPAPTLDALVSLCKRRGFIFPGSEIYGGLANTWDYGPLGIEFKNRVQRHWWRCFVQQRQDMMGIESAILMNPKVWEASGHVSNFGDPLIDCRKCKERFRGDKLLEEKLGVEAAAVLTLDQVQPMLMAEKIPCPSCGAVDWTPAKKFNLMFRTQQGVVEGEGNDIYLRPETAQGMFVNFKNIVQTMRPRLPFGVAQIGKSFRNEITPGNFTYRTREFEQMEIEYFVEPGTENEHYEAWKKELWNWYRDLGIPEDRMRFREHEMEERSHYSSMTYDIEYLFPWGWGELVGLANRGDFDLTQHEKFSGEDLKYTDPDDPTRKFLPYVVEPAFGCTRTVLTLLLEAYTEETLENGEPRTVLKFDRRIAPIDVAILPLSKKEHLIAKAQELYKKITQETDLTVDFDVTGSIGKRYRRQDEVGTPSCITVDFGTLGEDTEQGEKDTVTIRDRDTLKQVRLSIGSLLEQLKA